MHDLHTGCLSNIFGEESSEELRSRLLKGELQLVKRAQTELHRFAAAESH